MVKSNCRIEPMVLMGAIQTAGFWARGAARGQCGYKSWTAVGVLVGAQITWVVIIQTRDRIGPGITAIVIQILTIDANLIDVGEVV